MEKTYLFYDIETTGLNKCFDQVIQFAAIRTNLQLEELARHEYHIKLNCDVIPSPEAFITHRIRLSTLNRGLNEYEAIQKIHLLFNTPGTISLGYNSLGFDDEFLRFSFFRNLLPPYSHQYANQCSRMDLYPMTIMYYLFKNEHLKWPDNNLKLEHISRLNCFAEGQAHNAMVDVVASLNLARVLYQDRAVWNYLAEFFQKETDFERCQKASDENPVTIMIDGKFGQQQAYQAAVTSLGTHLIYKNKLLWLRIDLEAIKNATENSFIEHTWAVNKKLGESPWILPMKDRFIKNYLQQQGPVIQDCYQWLNKNNNLMNQIKKYYQNYTYPKIANLDHGASLYESSFLTFQEEDICKNIHKANPKDKIQFMSAFSKPHMKELLIRIIGRHYPDVLTGVLQEQFDAYNKSITQNNANPSRDYKGEKRLSVKEALNSIHQLREQALDLEQQEILKELEDYLSTKM